MNASNKKVVTIERGLRLMAGVAILLSLLLAHLHGANWLWFTTFVGANLLQSAFTNWCPAVWLLERLGLSHCVAREEQP
jgi:hypothetical protein